MEKAGNQEQEQLRWAAALKCPRCESSNTKFCYFNNYSLSQPRHFCKACKRYWTRGGTLRNVPVGGGCRRKNKRPSCSGDNKIIEGASSSPPSSSVSAHQPQIMAMNNPLFYDTIPMNLQFPPPLTRFDHLDGLGSVPLFSSGFHDAVSTSSSPFSSYNSNCGSASSPTMASLALNGSRILKQPHDQVTSHFQNQLQMQQLWQISNHAGLSDILEFNNAWQISGGL